MVFISCKNEAQEKSNTKFEKKDTVRNEREVKQKQYTVFKIDTIPDIKVKNEKSPKFIKKRLEKLIGNSVKKKCDSLNVSYPPQFVLFRAFKHEQEFEIWIADKRSDKLKLLATLPICAVDYTPGTKLRQGDGKTPEGIYNYKLLYGSSYSFMWIKLNSSEIDDYGEVGKGSSFKLCTDYPYQIDRNRTKKYLGKVSTGGEICIHGNCATAGCISFENKNFLPVFLTASFHNQKKYSLPKIHIFPFRFTEELKTKYAKEANSYMTANEIINFWNEIEKGYNLFEKTHKAIKVNYKGDKYFFKTF